MAQAALGGRAIYSTARTSLPIKLSNGAIVCVVGPTASGKTDIAQEIAMVIDGEVVSADSMQVYKGMDIGTGKIPETQRVVKHYCLDLVDPGAPYSAALFQDQARQAFHAINERNKRVILCGGTGFYVRAAIDDYDFPEGEQVGNSVREKYNAYAAEYGAQACWSLLNEKDPVSASLIAPKDVKRVVRAFELLDAGTNYASQKAKLASLPQRYEALFIGLSVEPDVLAERINARVDNMIDLGLVNEVQGLLDRGLREGITSPQAIGYKEIVEYLDGNCSLDEAVEQIKIATRRYAKRQRTWFRKDKRIHWIDANDRNLATMTNQALDIIHAFDNEL